LSKKFWILSAAVSVNVIDILYLYTIYIAY